MRQFRLLLITLLLFSPLSKAFELLPMVSFFSDSGMKSEHFFQINNTTDLPLPVEVVAKARSIQGEEGETLTDTDDFFVFPPQALIAPGKTQMVKVKYIGEPKAMAQSYRVIFSQLPIQDEEHRSSIKMLFQIGALVFVSPTSTNNLIDAEMDVNGDNQTLVLTNTGSGVVVLPALSFAVETDKSDYTWRWDSIKERVNRQFLVPGEAVRVEVDTLLNNETVSAVEVKGYQ